MDLGTRRLLVIYLLPILGHQRELSVHNRVHHRTIHRRYALISVLLLLGHTPNHTHIHTHTVCHPMRAQKMCTVHRAKNIIAGVWTFAVLYCSPWLFLTKTEPVFYKGRTNIETCTFALSRQFYKGLFLVDLIIFYIFPLLLSLVLYYLIARILFTDPISKSVSSGNSAEKNGDSSGRSATSRKPFSSEAQRSASQSTDSARSQVITSRPLCPLFVHSLRTLYHFEMARIPPSPFAIGRYNGGGSFHDRCRTLIICKLRARINKRVRQP